jgi:hypothetical protein
MRAQRRLELLFAQVLFATGCNSASNAPVDGSIADGEGGSVSDASTDVAEADAFDPCAPQQIQIDAGPPPEGGIECSYFFQYACGFRTDVVPRQSCYFSINDCEKMCPDPQFNCHAYGSWCSDGGIVPDAGPVILECVWCPGGVGRRPHGLVLDRPLASSAYGEWLARAAHLEAASVHAFRSMRRSLVAERAPHGLVRAACRAEHDERRHARVMTRLARANGATPTHVRIRRSRPRDFAIENIVEGCVRETFGALIAHWQAARASSPSLRRAMHVIAADETRHAALAWDTAVWARRRATPLERRRMRSALRAAVRDTERDAACPIHPELAMLAGLPDPTTQRAMLDGLEPLWRAL